ncbi:hypothetical protein BKA81DRAFT_350499 [Phyllosticta paracitricarpa]|uniref:Secreted protein n=1 Tax=Phyllosticta citricarpa TaxID=55181 RepID=A0ABR1MJP5_9PEZI
MRTPADTCHSRLLCFGAVSTLVEAINLCFIQGPTVRRKPYPHRLCFHSSCFFCSLAGQRALSMSHSAVPD